MRISCDNGLSIVRQTRCATEQAIQLLEKLRSSKETAARISAFVGMQTMSTPRLRLLACSSRLLRHQRRSWKEHRSEDRGLDPCVNADRWFASLFAGF